MARTVQDCIARKLWKFQRKMEDTHIRISGTQCQCAIVEVTYDKYNNTDQQVGVSGYVDVMMDFPMDEIPTSDMSSNSTESSNSNVLHMYDILPITANFRNEDIIKYEIKRDTIILVRLRNFDETFQVLKLQITDAVSKGNISSGVYYSQFVVAPVVSHQILNDPTFQSIVEELKSASDWN